MDIKKTFLSLTTRTYPHGQEHLLFDLLPQNLNMDDFGNLFIKIGDSDVMFTSHLDTATSAISDVNHIFDDNYVKTDGTSILGADDKAGVTILLYMIKNKIPGLYYFFLGEEVGCLGSKKVADDHKKEKLSYINKVISFDRRGTDSVITFQSGSRCCSDKFGEELAKGLNVAESSFKYEIDPTGVYTDSAKFVSIYPECTNISVGYYSEHTFNEKQDLNHLENLCKACCLIDWKSLPVERDPSKMEYSNYGYGCYGRWGWDDDFDYGYSNRVVKRIESPKEEKVDFFDDEFNYISSVMVNKTTKEISDFRLGADRLAYEEDLIYNFLNEIDLYYEKMNWDGNLLKVFYDDKPITYTKRSELMDYITELDLRSMFIDK